MTTYHSPYYGGYYPAYHPPPTVNYCGVRVQRLRRLFYGWRRGGTTRQDTAAAIARPLGHARRTLSVRRSQSGTHTP